MKPLRQKLAQYTYPQEMRALEDLLEGSLRVLAEGGRLSVITYHSLEDRIVKNYMRSCLVCQAAQNCHG